MAENVPGITITYQAKPCLPLLDYRRSVGLEPDFGFVAMLREDFRDFTIRESVPGIDILVENKTQEKPTAGARGFQSAGQLVLTEFIPGEPLHKVVWEQVLVTERGVEVAHPDDDGVNEAVRVELTDIRYLYGKRGFLSGWVNQPETDTSSSTKTSKGKGPRLIEGTTNGGAPWTLKKLLEKRVLPELPGAPRLKFISPSIADKQVGPKRWDAILTKLAIAELLDEFQAVFALNLDATVSIWKKNEGPLQLSDGQVITHDPSSPNVDGRVASARKLVSYRHVPAVAVVVGAPVIVAARMRLEAVGMLKGQIVPLVQALQGIGLDLGRATKFAFLSHEERSALLGVSEEGLREFERWAFKWFRLPGGTEAHADKLPILSSTAVADKTGQLLPLRVLSENHAVVQVLHLKDRLSLAGAVQRKQIAEKALGEVVKKLSNPFSTDTGKLSAQKKALEADIKKQNDQIALFQQFQGSAVADGIAEQLAKEKVEHRRVVVSLPFGEQTSGFKVNLQRGLVEFDAVQGRCASDGLPLEEASLFRSAVVELEFAYRRKPGPGDDLLLEHRYFSAWVRTVKDGKPSVEQRPKIPTGSAPLPILRPELQEIRQLDGKTNKNDLDAIARDLAEKQLLVEQTTQGAVVEFCRPVPVINTGTVLSLTWSVDKDGRPRVTANVGTYARFAPVPDKTPNTLVRGFEGLGERIIDSVFAPGRGP